MSTGLLPCPFCGGEAHIITTNDGCWVECYSSVCGGKIEPTFTEGPAITAWNLRTGPKEGDCTYPLCKSEAEQASVAAEAHAALGPQPSEQKAAIESYCERIIEKANAACKWCYENREAGGAPDGLLEDIAGMAVGIKQLAGAAPAPQGEPSPIGQQVADAQAEMAGWSDDRKAGVRLEGDATQGKAAPCCSSVDVVCVCAGSDADCPGTQAPPCTSFVAGSAERCAWCDHEEKCHPKEGKAAPELSDAEISLDELELRKLAGKYTTHSDDGLHFSSILSLRDFVEEVLSRRTVPAPFDAYMAASQEPQK